MATIVGPQDEGAKGAGQFAGEIWEAGKRVYGKMLPPHKEDVRGTEHHCTQFFFEIFAGSHTYERVKCMTIEPESMKACTWMGPKIGAKGAGKFSGRQISTYGCFWVEEGTFCAEVRPYWIRNRLFFVPIL